MGLRAVGDTRPRAFGHFNTHAGHLIVVGEKVLDEMEREIFYSFDGILAGNCIYGILHRVGGQNFLVVVCSWGGRPSRSPWNRRGGGGLWCGPPFCPRSSGRRKRPPSCFWVGA